MGIGEWIGRGRGEDAVQGQDDKEDEQCRWTLVRGGLETKDGFDRAVRVCVLVPAFVPLLACIHVLYVCWDGGGWRVHSPPGD